MELGAKLFDTHLVGFFLYANAVSPWLMFSPSVIVLRVNCLSIAVSQFPVFLSCLPSLLVLSVSFCFLVVVCLASAFTGSWQQTTFLLFMNYFHI